jgi:hypothetical protein
MDTARNFVTSNFRVKEFRIKECRLYSSCCYTFTTQIMHKVYHVLDNTLKYDFDAPVVSLCICKLPEAI